MTETEPKSPHEIYIVLYQFILFNHLRKTGGVGRVGVGQCRDGRSIIAPRHAAENETPDMADLNKLEIKSLFHLLVTNKYKRIRH